MLSKTFIVCLFLKIFLKEENLTTVGSVVDIIKYRFGVGESNLKCRGLVELVPGSPVVRSTDLLGRRGWECGETWT